MQLTRQQSLLLYRSVLADNDFAAIRELCKTDLFFLLVVACKRSDLDCDWLFDRCKEVQLEPDGYLDLWAREHYKTTIITFGKTIQDILVDPNVTIGIFSHTRPIAKGFLQQIKTELQINDFLQEAFPDVLYKEPQKESMRWSLDDGIVVKRTSNPKESTVEAWGLVDGQPTSKHFRVLVYDDIVTRESVTTPDMIKKVTEAFGLSLNLGVKENGKIRIIGTRYHANDTYKTVIDRRTAIPRIHTATNDGTFAGTPVFMTKEEFDKKVSDMGRYIAAAQLLQNPTMDKAQGFHLDWIEKYSNIADIAKLNKYVLCDPAGEKKKDNDYTVMAVIGLGEDKNYYLLEAIRDRLNLTERTKTLFKFVRKYNPISVGYEKYGMQSDIEHIEYVQELEGYRFKILELGGSLGKADRIRRLIPVFENHRFYLPHFCKFIDNNGRARDFVREFIDNEYETFPICAHDDMLDCISRIVDPNLSAQFPREVKVQYIKPYDPLNIELQEKYNPMAHLVGMGG